MEAVAGQADQPRPASVNRGGLLAARFGKDLPNASQKNFCSGETNVVQLLCHLEWAKTGMGESPSLVLDN
jgi:hypothetical protein